MVPQTLNPPSQNQVVTRIEENGRGCSLQVGANGELGVWESEVCGLVRGARTNGRLASVNLCYREQFVVTGRVQHWRDVEVAEWRDVDGIFVRIDFGRDPLVNIDRLECGPGAFGIATQPSN